MQAVSDRVWLAGRMSTKPSDLWRLDRVVYFGGDCVESETPSFSGACASLHAKAAEEF
jgi:hypothetical protein